MGKSSISHAKKSDKETQSPMLKIFKEIIMRERDTEKIKLIKDKKKKKKNHSSSQSKSGPATRPFQSEKRDSWWFWGEAEDTKKNNNVKDDNDRETFSCVSCALKRFLNNDFACVSCLLFLFSITAIAAFVILFKTIPMISQGVEKDVKEDSAAVELAKRFNGEYGPRKDRSAWMDTNPGRLGGLSAISENGYGDVGAESSGAMDSDGLTSDLSSVLRNNRVDMARSSDHIKEFYKKLIQVDAHIKKLKRGYFEGLSGFPDRPKRSLFNLRHKLKTNKANGTKNVEIQNNTSNLTGSVNQTLITKGSDARPKRDQSIHEFVVEKHKFYLQYLPDQKKVPKCSHAPKDSKPHENQLTHPFYKNTQRLDELLDQVMNKKVPILDLDPMPEEVVVDLPCKHKEVDPNAHAYENVEDPFLMLTPSEDVGSSKNDMKIVFPYDIALTSTPSWLELSSATLNPNSDSLKHSSDSIVKFPVRKLLQADQGDEEPIGYEDIKEVLSDDSESHDEEEPADRVRREEKENPNVPVEQVPDIPKPAYTGVHNPNWKGPMPLYPDEINTMIKSAAMQNVNKVEIPINTKDLTAEHDQEEFDAPDVQYIEDYINSKYDKLVEMAQAYSDYGVLEGKKEEIIAKDKNQPVTEKFQDRRVKMAADIQSDDSIASLEFSTKSNMEKEKQKSPVTKSEGFKIEFHRGNQPADSLEEHKTGPTSLSKHVKIMNEGKNQNHGYHMTTLFPAQQSRVHFMNDKMQTEKNSLKSNPSDFSYSLIKLKRSLKSIDVEEDDSSLFEIYPEFKYSVASNDTGEVVKVDGKEDTGERVELVNRTDTGYLEDNFTGFNADDKPGDISDPPVKRLNTNRRLTIKEKLRRRRTLDDSDLDKDDVKTRIKKYKFELHNIKAREKINSSDAGLNKKFIREVTEGYTTDIVTIDTTVYVDDTNLNNIEADALKLNNSLINSTRNTLLQDVNFTQVKEYNATFGPGDFFMMMSDFFSSLAGVSLHDNSSDPEERIVNLFSKLSSVNESQVSSTTDMSYPMYDSDMVDNIGHRSRVLLSIEEHPAAEDMSNSTATLIENETTKSANVTTTPAITSEEVTKHQNDNKANQTEAKTIVKRNAIPDNNLIFWNDIYDDEYGVQLDPLDNVIRSKHNTKEVLKKSTEWIHDKVKNFTQKSKEIIMKKLCCGKHDKLTTVKFELPADYDAVHKLVKRQNNEEPNEWTDELYKKLNKAGEDKPVEFINEKQAQQPSAVVSESEMKKNFIELTEHMREVCRQAAAAVHHTRNLEVRQDKAEEAQSTSLMHQLVRLMSDLVDYQIQLKTCLKLPADLHEFLDWLTNPPSIDPNVITRSENQKEREDTEAESSIEPTQRLPTATPVNDVKGECLSSMRNVQDLFKMYQGLSETDKSQMTGVKEYLEQQMTFLSKKLAAMEDIFDIPTNAYQSGLPVRLRNRRSNHNQPLHYKSPSKTPHDQKNQDWKLTKFLRNFGKKHTRTTASHDDVSDSLKKVSNNLNLESKGAIDNLVPRAGHHKPVKRNLKDIYYRALAEAKKYTTVKNLH